MWAWLGVGLAGPQQGTVKLVRSAKQSHKVLINFKQANKQKPNNKPNRARETEREGRREREGGGRQLCAIYGRQCRVSYSEAFASAPAAFQVSPEVNDAVTLRVAVTAAAASYSFAVISVSDSHTHLHTHTTFTFRCYR